jgi:hypothetical protein
MEDKIKNSESGPALEAIEKKPAHILLGMPRGCSSAEAEGRIPVVIHGENNHITIIERQYNDRSAVDTLNRMLDAEKEQRDTVNGIIDVVKDLAIKAFNKTMESPKVDTKPQTDSSAPPAPIVVAKPKRKSPVKKATKKATTKKAAKKTAKKSTKKRN